LGSATYRGYALIIRIQLSTKTLQLDNVLLNSSIKAFGVQETKFSLAGNTFVDLAKKNISIKELQLSSGEMSIQLNAEVNDYSDPAFKGNLLVPEFSLGNFLKVNKLSQPVWQNDSALQRFGFSCGFAGNMKKIDVSAIDVLLDDAHGTGSFVLLDPSNPAYDFTMHFDHLNFDSYKTVVPESKAVAGHAMKEKEQKAQKVQKEGAVSGNVSTKKAPSLQPVFPVEPLRKLQFNLDLGVDSLKMKGAQLTQVKLKASGKDGRLELNPFRAELYNGSLAAVGTLDVTGALPQLAIKGDVAQVEVGPLLTDMTGKEEVTGTAVLSLELSTNGNIKEQLIRNSNGTTNLALEDGVVKKLHILEVVRQAKALYEKKNMVEAAKDEPTGFARISATGVITNGVFQNNDLKAESDMMRVAGSGKVDFVAEYVDYLLKVSILRGMDRDDKSGKTDYSKFIVPYRIEGKFSGITQKADVVEIFKAETTTLLIGELQKQLNKNKKGDDSQQGDKEDSTQDLLQQGLKSLFGN